MENVATTESGPSNDSGTKKVSEVITDPVKPKAKESKADLNKSTADNAGEKIVKSGGESVVNFDEFDALEAKKTREKVLEKRNKKHEPKAKETEVKGAKEAEVKEGVSKEGESVEALVKEVAKTWKLKNGESEVELRADMKVPIKIDGEMVEVDFQELMNDYSGKTAIAKRFNEYNVNNQKFTKDKTEVDGFLKRVFEASKENPLDGLMIAAEHAGLDPVQYQMNLMDSLTTFSSKWAEMSDVERENYKLNLENSRYKNQTETFKKHQETEKAQKALDQDVQRVEQEIGVNREQFADAFFKLEAAAKGGLIKGEITPALVKEYLIDQKVNETAKSVLSAVSESVVTRENQNTMVKIMYDYPEFSKEELVEIAKESFGKKAHMVVSEKIAKANPQVVDAKKAINPTKDDLWSFDQIR